ncbi:tetratricopeptide repeat protein [Rufibacter soli]|jgi:tetratricopeptide (TPR) repeat protein
MKVFKVVSFVLAFSALALQGVAAIDVTSATENSAKEKIRKISLLIKREPSNSQAYADRAAAKMEAKDMYGAIHDFSAALTLSSASNSQFLLGRGTAFLEIGAYKEAHKDFSLALENTSSAELLYGRAVAAYFLDDYFGALRDLDQVIAIAPNHPKALYNRAVVKMELKQLDSAAEDLESFLSHFPNHAEAERALALADAAMQK